MHPVVCLHVVTRELFHLLIGIAFCQEFCFQPRAICLLSTPKFKACTTELYVLFTTCSSNEMGLGELIHFLMSIYGAAIWNCIIIFYLPCYVIQDKSSWACVNPNIKRSFRDILTHDTFADESMCHNNGTLLMTSKFTLSSKTLHWTLLFKSPVFTLPSFFFPGKSSYLSQPYLPSIMVQLGTSIPSKNDSVLN